MPMDVPNITQLFLSSPDVPPVTRQLQQYIRPLPRRTQLGSPRAGLDVAHVFPGSAQQWRGPVNGEPMVNNCEVFGGIFVVNNDESRFMVANSGEWWLTMVTGSWCS